MGRNNIDMEIWKRERKKKDEIRQRKDLIRRIRVENARGKKKEKKRR